MDRELARIAELHHGVFAAHHLDALGFSREARSTRIETGRWIGVHDGVFRMAGTPITWRGALVAACWAGGVRAVASHRSAAALRSLPSGRTEIAELTCPRWRRARHEGIVVHESLVIDPEDLDHVAGIPCTSVARTLFDLARSLSPVMLDANIDTALRRELVTVTELRSTSERLATKGRPGGRRFRAAVDARSVASATPESVPERLLSDMLIRQGLPTPIHQYVIRDAVGGFVARVDLAYPDAKLVIEYDSIEHHTGSAAHFRDAARRNAISDLEFVVLVATAADLKDGGSRLSASVQRHLRTRGCVAAP